MLRFTISLIALEPGSLVLCFSGLACLIVFVLWDLRQTKQSRAGPSYAEPPGPAPAGTARSLPTTAFRPKHQG